jgi:hypothetical protein
MLALCVIGALTGRPVAPQLPQRLMRQLRARLHEQLAKREEATHGVSERELSQLLSLEELELLCVVGWRMRCALTAEPLDSRRLNLELVRRDCAQGPTVGNLLLLRADLARAHEAGGARAADGWSAADRTRIERTCALLTQSDAG